MTVRARTGVSGRGTPRVPPGGGGSGATGATGATGAAGATGATGATGAAPTFSETNEGNTGAAKTIDYSTGEPFRLVNVDQNTVLTITPPATAKHFQLRLTYGGVFTVAFAGTIYWLNGAAFSPNTSADWDIITFYGDGANVSASFGTGGYSN